MENGAKISFYGGVSSVTGANFIFEKNDLKIMVDCGLAQGSKFADDQNREDFPYNPKEVNFLLVTHAHIDHIGRIPKLVRDGFRGKIYSTKETLALAGLMFDDALGIMEQELLDGQDVLYEKEDVGRTMSLWQGLSYNEKITLGQGVEFIFKDAGHILGSAMAKITFDGKKILFTGDVGNSPSPILKDTDKIRDIDYIVMESVYGDRNHEGVKERRNILKRIIKDSVNKGGVLMIPAFSIEKTQVLLHEINHMIEGGEIDKVPVFLDSPLAIRVTEVYKDMRKNFNEHVQEVTNEGDEIFDFPGLHITRGVIDSKNILKTQGAKIIIAGSGMSTGGRIIHHEKNYLSDPNNTILFVGYQAAGSLGREIQDGIKRVKIGNSEVEVRSKIENIFGYSSHKDSDNLVDFVAETQESLKKAFVVMGERKSALFLVQKLRDYLNINAIHPEENKSYELEG